MKVQVAVHSSRSLIILTVSVDVQQGKAIVNMLHECLWGTCKQLVLHAGRGSGERGGGGREGGGCAFVRMS